MHVDFFKLEKVLRLIEFKVMCKEPDLTGYFRKTKVYYVISAPKRRFHSGSKSSLKINIYIF